MTSVLILFNSIRDLSVEPILEDLPTVEHAPKRCEMELRKWVWRNDPWVGGLIPTAKPKVAIESFRAVRSGSVSSRPGSLPFVLRQMPGIAVRTAVGFKTLRRVICGDLMLGSR